MSALVLYWWYSYILSTPFAPMDRATLYLFWFMFSISANTNITAFSDDDIGTVVSKSNIGIILLSWVYRSMNVKTDAFAKLSPKVTSVARAESLCLNDWPLSKWAKIHINQDYQVQAYWVFLWQPWAFRFDKIIFMTHICYMLMTYLL